LESELSDPAHWDSRSGKVRARLPSRLNVTVRDLTALLGRHIKPNDKVIEIGCAPGKYLLWCALAGQSKVSGIEYAPKSWQTTVDLFRAMDVSADIRKEDVFASSFEPTSFDVVYSIGLIEHFTGTKLVEIVQKHVDLLKPGGKAVIIVPNLRDIYGAIFKRLDRKTYDTHNIEMMTIEAMLALAPAGTTATTYHYGSLSPWQVVYDGPKTVISKLAMYGLNLIGLVQPFRVKALCPWLVLEIVRQKTIARAVQP
jgi:2-polyprenyl-3-methyl-5-hydroxy-6-metoxy-1,4-benzoquinol methylase